jgi:acyl carrier protein
MSIRKTILSEIEKIAEEQNAQLAPLTDNLRLIDSGLDSLGFAILAARLEDVLEVDPFTEANEARYPTTLGDFINLYETATPRVRVNSGPH